MSQTTLAIPTTPRITRAGLKRTLRVAQSGSGARFIAQSGSEAWFIAQCSHAGDRQQKALHSLERSKYACI